MLSSVAFLCHPASRATLCPGSATREPLHISLGSFWICRISVRIGAINTCFIILSLVNTTCKVCVLLFSEQAGRVKCPVDPYFIIPDRCVCVDFQTLRLQESPDAVPHGEMPRHMQLYCDRYACAVSLSVLYFILSPNYHLWMFLQI